MKLAGKRQGERIAPLEQVTLCETGAGFLSLRDGLGREYARVPVQGEVQLVVGGAPGWHSAVLEDAEGQERERLTFPVEAHTHLRESSAQFSELLQLLQYSMEYQWESDRTRYQGRIYHFFVRWLRDHVHTLKGMKYFAGRLKEGIDFFRDTQREDGMIWDNVYPRTKHPNYWDVRFQEGDFIRPFEDYSAELKRIPVECDVEYLFVEGLYYTWKAVGDDGWMEDSLDAARRALDYCITSPYRWSDKYQLLKRGHTIDTWDFQDEENCTVEHDAMRVHPDKTHFGVMFGDNTGYAMACDYLAEMLEHAGRAEEARTYWRRGQEIRRRLDEVSWNGRFFTHHVPEAAEHAPDLGVDETSQVSLSNAYSLNRGISHEQSVAIIKTYQQIRDELPAGSPGEWYTIYPPFQRGYGSHNQRWQYMNGGVTSIVAGELAHGAFQHGFENYAVDILRRLLALGKRYGNILHCTYTGAFSAPPAGNFTPLDLSSCANIAFSGEEREGVPGWTGEGDNDLHEMPVGAQRFAGIDFLVPDPAVNGGRGCIGLRQRSGYAQRVEIPVTREAASIYFLHTVSQTKAGGVAGTITLHYADGSAFSQYVVRDINVRGWWLPYGEPTAYNAWVSAEDTYGEGSETLRVAWAGKNKHSLSVGMMAYGLDNPHPERQIDHITLTAAEDGAFWAVAGITLSDQPVEFPPSPISYGIPDSWGAAAVVYALIEGLVGVIDSGVSYSHATLTPRWAAARVDHAEATIAYPDSSGYLAYSYTHNSGDHALHLTLTGNGEDCHCHLLLPAEARSISSVTDGEKACAFHTSHVEQSQYVDFTVDLPGPCAITIRYQ